MKTFLLSVVALMAWLHCAEGFGADQSLVIKRAVNTAESTASEISAAELNLTGMRNSLGSSESQVVSAILSEAALLVAKASPIVLTGDVYAKMKDKDDRATVLRFFRFAARAYTKQVAISLPWINSCLTQITTPAALAEATAVRDKMLEARASTQQFDDEGT